MKTTWGKKLAVALARFTLISAILYGCSSEARPGASDVGQVDPNRFDQGACSNEGDQRACYELLSVQAGVRSCLQGKQTCHGGRWSVCAGGTIAATSVGTSLSALSAGHVKVLTASANVCVDNPCNPNCRVYDENNMGAGWTATLDPMTMTYSVKTVTLDHAPTCAGGERFKWGELAWSATAPGNSQITFEVRTFDNAGSPSGAWTTVGTVPTDPANCSGASPGCPKSLSDPPIAALNPDYANLQLKITLTPPTATPQVSPTLDHYKLSYSCVPTE